jgi:PAS domain S-box-containing protein
LIDNFPVAGRRLLLIGLGVAVAYVLAARVGFAFASAAEQVTTVWAPTGISLAALLLFGVSLWPAIWIGAFAANAGSEAPLWTAAVIATGNTLEALSAAWMLRQLPSFDPTLRRVRDAIAFILLGAGISVVVSATVGVVTLCGAGVQPWARFSELWWAWWLGDTLGALVVAPVLLTSARRTRWTRKQWIDAVLLVAGVVTATHIVFGQVFGTATASHPLEYVIFPFVIAAAVRSGQAITALVVLAGTIVAIWNTAQGAGPFAGPALHQSLVLLQAFMGILAGTGLLLAAAIAERRTGERRRAAAHAVGQVLAGAPTLLDAAPAILRAIRDNIDWQVAALWLVDRSDQRLHCHAVSSPHPTTFVSTTQGIVFEKGVGLPGRVWATGAPAWIANVVVDGNFPRAAVARDAGLHGAFGFPIPVDDDVIGVVECFNRDVLTPDPDLLGTMSVVGAQIGQFIARKHDEAAIAEEQRRTMVVLQTAPDAVIGMDHRGAITEFNAAAVSLFGYPREQALGQDLATLIIPPALRQQHRDGLAHFLATGLGRFINRRVETTGCHADGHEFPVEISITRVPGMEPPTFTGFVRDLTKRAEAERERERLLQREAAARSEAEAANRAKDEFLATLSHELRTPLNAIVGWTHMLLNGHMDDESTKRALEVIARNAHLQAQLIADILDVSRIITGGVRLDVRPVDLGAMIGAALDAVRPAATARRVQLRSRLEASSPVIQGDPQRLQQVIWNLLSNAVKFTEAGGVVSVDLIDAGPGEIQIRVHDTGAGIAPDFLPHVFERFRQADGSTSRHHGGLGLGLSIVRHLVELHGGSVRAESAGMGQGSTFIVQLPRARTDVSQSSASTPAVHS